jgi:hypothetical protein
MLILFIKIIIKNKIIMEEYNKNYVIKLVGYFKIYIYKYSDYIMNKNILEPGLIEGRIGIIYLYNRNKTIEHNITSMLLFGNFLSYSNFVSWIDRRINISIEKMKLSVRECKSLLIAIKI